MRYGIRCVLIGCTCAALVLAGSLPIHGEDTPDVVAARKARDQTDVESLRKAIEKVRNFARIQNSSSAYEQLAQFELWLCEAGHSRNDDKLIRQAAEDGVAAAEKAVALNPNSSEAHRLVGDSLGELIPVAFAGGVRYGPRSTDELDKAIHLDSKNSDAYVGRAISYFFTPAAFGGSREKAIQMLKKAVEVNPNSDTPHIWLAKIYFAAQQQADALREINEARRLNPDRGFSKYVYGQIAAAPNQKGSTR